ncbi:MAG: hypothetical protein EOO72_06250, partial [Myxococcaceae bacterium]
MKRRATNSPPSRRRSRTGSPTRSRCSHESISSSRGVSDMAKQESLGIKTLESIHWYVHDLERSRQFYT